MKRMFLGLLVMFAALASVNSAKADIINPSFELGFSSWSTSGSTAVVGTAFGTVPPTSGSSQAQLQTLTGTTTAAGALATFVGISGVSLEALATGTVTEGSAIKQTFTTPKGGSFTIAFGVADQGDTAVNSALLVDNIQIAADGTLSFNWNFITDELNQGVAFNDFAFVVFNGTAILLKDKNSFVGNGPAVPGFDGSTGTQTFSQLFEELAVPEPASMTLFGAIAIGGAFYGWRRRKIAAAA